MAEELIHVYSTGSTGPHWVTRSWLDEQDAERRAAREAELVPIREFAAKHALLDVDRISEMVLDLHSPGERFVCQGCDGYDDPPWPCRTVLIARDYGLEGP